VDIETAIRREIGVLNQHDAAGVAAFYTEDVVFVDVSLDQPLRGRAAMKHYLEEFFAAVPDLRVEIRAVFGNERIATAEYDLSGTQRGALDGRPPTGKSFRLSAASVYDYDGQLFTRETFYWDSASMLRQLGHE
jgi:steroid delta-isomerase-like uncharacterized protein